MPSALVLLLFGLSAFVGTRLLVSWLHLRKAPGPILAGATDLWRAYQQYNGQLRSKLCDLHAQHGPIVRYGVRSISISDPEVISIVYGSRAGFTTASYVCILDEIPVTLISVLGIFLRCSDRHPERERGAEPRQYAR